ncbi:type IV pilin [Photobacterium kishitanii]|uniref:Prepilin-type N-terminal cleavage/methylation domain-containing protein n=1 Tax=Photobacterium kishitanii TaxID=318456 RepID=A0AAX0YU21_9GAMM|nr:prepilin-type N-terminal cleavage/methylation domain-containing protein [Photobacterium kishitanii]KJG09945.1 type IV pilin [Photobacterium kishitanii]KJG58553.1 type IV pilin [Photobacterium kishitanii]KJG61841.1 type IV pilin [Photobacterium kishitanii]KJG66408.1 type IV pilin [Photobacterium kishitanii]KJG70102.1 type IV pilin [Photobacterium kishitanii]
MTSNIKIEKGFSLLEVVIALGVLAVGVLGLVKMQAYMEVKAENALKTLDALHIAEAQMEFYQTRASNISGATGLIAFESMAAPINCLHSMVSGSNYTLTCDADTLSLSDALRIINVTVSWRDRRGVSQAVSLKTAISKYSEFD